ncbi:MAG: DNA alkylation repair protein [Anaerolineaceae bacterium]|nr:DNA alkylation repair protein [Anaerolineaceae bacterium]
MPAVQLDRLKNQITELTRNFTRPVDFQRELYTLFDFYSNHAFKPGKAVTSTRRVESFHVPAILLNQLEQALEPFARENPVAALFLADTMWKDKYLETRLLAAALLGMMPVSFSEEIIDRLKHWPQPGTDPKSLEALLTTGARQLRRERQEHWFDLLRDWLSSSSIFANLLGLYALIPAVREREFENLPLIFQVIHPFVENPVPALETKLIELLGALAKRTPLETLYFLKHHLGLSDRPAVSRLVRRVIPAFNPEYQNRLKSLLLERSKPGSIS